MSGDGEGGAQMSGNREAGPQSSPDDAAELSPQMSGNDTNTATPNPERREAGLRSYPSPSHVSISAPPGSKSGP
jgi:hypothetical protein